MALSHTKESIYAIPSSCILHVKKRLMCKSEKMFFSKDLGFLHLIWQANHKQTQPGQLFFPDFGLLSQANCLPAIPSYILYSCETGLNPLNLLLAGFFKASNECTSLNVHVHVHYCSVKKITQIVVSVARTVQEAASTYEEQDFSTIWTRLQNS